MKNHRHATPMYRADEMQDMRELALTCGIITGIVFTLAAFGFWVYLTGGPA